MTDDTVKQLLQDSKPLYERAFSTLDTIMNIYEERQGDSFDTDYTFEVLIDYMNGDMELDECIRLLNFQESEQQRIIEQDSKVVISKAEKNIAQTLLKLAKRLHKKERAFERAGLSSDFLDETSSDLLQVVVDMLQVDHSTERWLYVCHQYLNSKLSLNDLLHTLIDYRK